MRGDCYLFSEEHVPQRARFPVVEAHNHIWGDWAGADSIVEVMDRAGVVTYCNLTANAALVWTGEGYGLEEREIDEFFERCAAKHPGRFYGFTTATFCRSWDVPLFTGDGRVFVERTLEVLRKHVEKGARGLKVLKELGLRYRDGQGRLIRIDDELLAPIWAEAGRLGVPVLIHHSDPYGFFEPVSDRNEHSDSLRKYPSWAFSGPGMPAKNDLLRRRDHLLTRHPQTTFLLPHVANFAENLAYVSELLERFPNVYIDFSARLDELGRQPYTSREFFLEHQDRIFFGTDMPASVEMYRCYFRFLETYDEYFIPPDYDGTFGRHRRRICGIGLPDSVLRKVYFGNASKFVPGPAKELEVSAG